MRRSEPFEPVCDHAEQPSADCEGDPKLPAERGPGPNPLLAQPDLHGVAQAVDRTRQAIDLALRPDRIAAISPAMRSRWESIRTTACSTTVTRTSNPGSGWAGGRRDQQGGPAFQAALTRLHQTLFGPPVANDALTDRHLLRGHRGRRRRELRLHQLGKQSVPRQQRLERALLDDPAVSNTRISSASRTVDSRCAMMNVVRPAISVFNARLTRASVAASSALVASSRIRIGGFFNNARAIARRCR